MLTVLLPSLRVGGCAQLRCPQLPAPLRTPRPGRRALSTQLLFTQISIEDPRKSVRNGGPAAYGPNAGAHTTYWNVRSDTGSHPPPDHNGTPGYAPRDCTFGAGESRWEGSAPTAWRGARLHASWLNDSHPSAHLVLRATPILAHTPADLNFIGVAFYPPDELCPTYVHQQAPALPANLYRAQRERRLRLQAKSLTVPAANDAQGPWNRYVQALMRAASSWHY